MRPFGAHRLLVWGTMRILCSVVLACLLPNLIVAQVTGPATFQANWQSLDSRSIPKWWTEAKFGIFIHWGPYSVPAFSKVGQYSEWYWMNLRNSGRPGHAETLAFHNQVYGEGFSYADFVPKFRCEMFDPAAWAQIFEQSGAKYVVLTSKHHDGYTLWPSQEAEKSWGRPWSATNSGPKRDLLGELTREVRKTGVRMGVYYSLYEWYNPLYAADPKTYVDKHMVPQFKDLVSNYAPEIIFSDGEWDHPDDLWQSKELLAWLYNESPCRESVVVNDRWGKSTRHKHGSYFTTEYGAGLPDASNPWEENRGMAHSFGYSRTENLGDYKSSQELLYMLIDIVSRGGNFLLDIGPTADGRIPVIMQQRLADIGAWLDTNGEAIYGTETFEHSCQWSEGKRQAEKYGRHRVKYDVMKLAVSPNEGFARKEILFTRKGDILYCICPVFPEEKLVVRDVQVQSDAKVDILGVEGALQWQRVGNDLHIDVPSVNPSAAPCRHAFVFRIKGLNRPSQN